MNQQIIKHFQKNDEVLFSVMKKMGPVQGLHPDKPENYFSRLCREIIGQQLADKASRAIFSRFEKLFSGKITSCKALKVSHQAMRKAGLSNAKAKYIRNLAEDVVNKKLNFKDLKNLDNEQVIKELIKVKGIGPWTAEMFLMFTLARKDVFSPGDLGLRKAIKRLYGFKKEPTEKQIKEITDKWRPYRTYACLILWKSLDI